MIERPLHRLARQFLGLDELAQGFVDVHGGGLGISFPASS